MANLAVLDATTGIVVQVTTGDPNTFSAPPGTYAVLAPAGTAAGAQYNNPSDGTFAPAGSPLISQAALNLTQLHQGAGQALTGLRNIRDSAQITTVNLAAIQALQAAVQDEARTLIQLVRMVIAQTDGQT